MPNTIKSSSTMPCEMAKDGSVWVGASSFKAGGFGNPLDAQPRTAQSLKRLLHAAPTVLVHPAADVSLIPLRRIRIVTTMRCFRWSTCTWKRAFHA